MENLDFLFDKILEINSLADTVPFDLEDIRRSFFEFHESLLRNYYMGLCFVEINADLQKGNIMLGEKSQYFKHLRNKKKGPNFHEKSYLHNLNRRVFLDSWSNFETCVNVLVNGIISEGERKHLLNYKVSDMISSLKKIGISVTKNECANHFIVDHLTHVPIVRKLDFLFKKIEKGYERNISDDKEFLKFFGKLRNTMHSNFIYYGNNYEYYFGHAHFIFENNQIVKWFDPFEGTPKLQVYLVNNIMEIWRTVISKINYPEIIPYPCPEQD